MNTLLEEYTPQLRIGLTVAEARERDPELFLPSGGSANLTDTTVKNINGFRWLQLRLSLPLYESMPDSDERITAIEVWSTKMDAPEEALNGLITALGEPNITGCLVAESTPLSSIRVWNSHRWRFPATAVALETPIDSNHYWSARITFFDARRSLQRVFGLHLINCPKNQHGQFPTSTE
jgi:hypothetical protein